MLGTNPPLSPATNGAPRSAAEEEMTPPPPLDTRPPAPETSAPRVAPSSTRLQCAIAYARHGIPVFPVHWIRPDGRCSCGQEECSSAGKHPIEKGWQELATADESVIREWWKRTPEANIGALCGPRSNLTVLVVDGDIGRDTLRSLEKDRGELP